MEVIYFPRVRAAGKAWGGTVVGWSFSVPGLSAAGLRATTTTKSTHSKPWEAALATTENVKRRKT